ncbi:hypothetical protein D7Z26_19735 [Cohnella endophytica]|uniref:Uncharacterized protein n=1 Tax=Cohnella endophytica TaxID=2419778 RepID=A0A494XH35_9BACL|nr:hypothetical protein [Cohnella endophytica]RKP50047.1 hypothetical protein D7Z26_19735 [Cohnella endophytica]
MTKLDGNERWKSKMLLTEHQEQYQNRHNKTLTGRATNEELTMIRDVIMFPHMLTMSDKSLQEVRRTPNLYKRLFEQAVQLIMNKISKDLFALRRELKNRNIKVFDDETADGIIYHRYVCRGYEDKFGIVRETLRSEISVRLAQYASSVFHPESEGNKPPSKGHDAP